MAGIILEATIRMSNITAANMCGQSLVYLVREHQVSCHFHLVEASELSFKYYNLVLRQLLGKSLSRQHTVVEIFLYSMQGSHLPQVTALLAEVLSVRPYLEHTINFGRTHKPKCQTRLLASWQPRRCELRDSSIKTAQI
ncbi:hypothetical protein PoB_002542600 [Plakobranchus ocellatus]|uniref:Uncharacterized protein n=1 Tax=Plakobranchus ocellatus TaxID=259542 RepID=A0AAV3ZWK2_9GAST|nr:hypothetical protein PoB_002542600 [Plakobranchus ocellatus]